MTSIRTRTAHFALGFALVFIPATTQAVPLSALLQGGVITANDKIFTDWTFIDLQTVNGGFANLGLIDVTPLIDDPLDPGVKFTAPIDGIGTPFGHTGLSSVHFVFSFNARTVDGTPRIKDNSLLINGWTFDSHPEASIQIAEEVFDAAGNKLGDKLAIARPSSFAGDPSLFDTAEFFPQAFVHVVKTIDIVGPLDNDGARLRMFEQRFSQTPEPSSLFVACVAGLGVVVCRVRRSR
jgi:hypothetical protein